LGTLRLHAALCACSYAGMYLQTCETRDLSRAGVSSMLQ